jgi:hypothetical protein
LFLQSLIFKMANFWTCLAWQELLLPRKYRFVLPGRSFFYPENTLPKSCARLWITPRFFRRRGASLLRGRTTQDVAHTRLMLLDGRRMALDSACGCRRIASADF